MMEFTIKANERSQVELLERDVLIQFLEIRKLRAENEKLKKQLNHIREIVKA